MILLILQVLEQQTIEDQEKIYKYIDLVDVEVSEELQVVSFSLFRKWIIISHF